MLERLRSALSFGREKAQDRIQLFVQRFMDWKDAAWPRITFSRLVDEALAKHATVFACVQLWATTIPGARMKVYDVSKSEQGDVDRRHPVSKILGRPNPFMSQREFLRYFVTYGAVGGISFAWKERDRVGRVKHLWPLHRGQVSPIPDPDGWCLGYKFDPGNGIPLFIPAEDIIPWRWAIDPNSPLDGMSPLVACARGVDTGAEAMRHVYALLRNRAQHGMAIIVKTVLPPAIKKKMLEQYDTQYGGDNAGKPAVIEGEEARLERTTQSLQELQAEALHDVPDAWICEAFGVPGTLIGTTGGMKRAIQGAPREMLEYWTETGCIPRWHEIEDAFQIHLLEEEYGDEGYEVRFDLSEVRALAEDVIATRNSILNALRTGQIMIDEARQMDPKNLPELPDGKGQVLFWNPQNVMPIDGPAPVPALPAPTEPEDNVDAEDPGGPPQEEDAVQVKAIDPETGKFKPKSKRLAPPGDPTYDERDAIDAAVRLEEWVKSNMPEYGELFSTNGTGKR